MIKGVNRQIIEITQTGNNYFERAWLVIKPEYSNVGAGTLENEADKYLKNLRPPCSMRGSRAVMYWLVRLGAAAAVGCILTVAFFQSGLI